MHWILSMASRVDHAQQEPTTPILLITYSYLSSVKASLERVSGRSRHHQSRLTSPRLRTSRSLTTSPSPAISLARPPRRRKHQKPPHQTHRKLPVQRLRMKKVQSRRISPKQQLRPSRHWQHPPQHQAHYRVHHRVRLLPPAPELNPRQQNQQKDRP